MTADSDFSPARRHQCASGFTLIEVLVALIVVSLAALAVHTQVLQAARNARLIQERTLGSWSAQNKLTELRLTEGLPATGRDDGDIEFANRNWVWESKVEPPSGDVQNFVRIDISVFLDNNRDQAVATAVGFAGQGASGAQARPFDTHPSAPGPGEGNGDADEENGNPRQPVTPPGGRLTPRGAGT